IPPQAISAIAPSTIGSATRSHKLGRSRDGQAIRGKPQRCSMLPLADGPRRCGGAYQYPTPGGLAKPKFQEAARWLATNWLRFLLRAAELLTMSLVTIGTGVGRGYRREAPSKHPGIGAGRTHRQSDEHRVSGAAARRRQLQLRGRHR